MAWWGFHCLGCLTKGNFSRVKNGGLFNICFDHPVFGLSLRDKMIQTVIKADGIHGVLILWFLNSEGEANFLSWFVSTAWKYVRNIWRHLGCNHWRDKFLEIISVGFCLSPCKSKLERVICHIPMKRTWRVTFCAVNFYGGKNRRKDGASSGKMNCLY